MSNINKDVMGDCELGERCGSVRMVLQPRDKDLGGFSVRRSLPTRQLKTIGPWIFFDHMGPATFPAGEGINVRPHPHIGIATVTYLFDGEILHRDSLGNVQPITPGDINLMVAGSGIVHSERERPEVTQTEHSVNALQLRLALPSDHEEDEPAFHHYPSSSIPAVSVDDVPIRVMMGNAYGVISPVKAFSKTLYLEAELKRGQSLLLPTIEEMGVYVVHGHLLAKDTDMPQHSMVVLDNPQGVVIEATQDSRIAVIGGDSLGKRFIDWNFVSSRKERIEQAKDDWTQGRFAKIPGDDKELIPLP